MRYPELFAPITVGSTRLKNRIAMAPVNNSSQMDPISGQATMTMVDYFAERARGGAGLLITGVFKVEYEIEQCYDADRQIRKWCYFSPQSTLMLGELVARTHAYDSKVFFQLSAGPGRVTPPDTIRSGVQPVSASENDCFFAPDVTCRALTTDEVERIVEAFGRAAAFAKSINADGIEIHGHEGYLIDQFTTSLWNRRTDKYGGDLRARLTFPIEILRAIRAAAGDDFTVTYRMGVRHFIEAPQKGAFQASATEIGRDVQESVEMARLLEEAGYDGFSVDVGAYESSYWAHPPHYLPHGFALDMTSVIKEAVSVPVMVAGRLGQPSVAAGAIVAGKTDIVALGRDLLADADWPNKVARGDIDDIRPCIGCHDGCMERTRTEGLFLSCSVNPSTSRERNARLFPAIVKKRVVVAGGGAAGMEFARIASQRGHDVTMFERSGVLGGHMLEYGVPGFKDDIKSLLAWYRRQIEKSDVHVVFDTELDVDTVRALDPDVVVTATGSSYQTAEHDANFPRVVPCTDALRGHVEVSGRVVVVGAASHGSETALWLAQNGHDVTIVEQREAILLGAMNRINRDLLVDLLDDNGVRVVAGTTFNRVVAEGIEVVRRDGTIGVVEADLVVMAVGISSNASLYSGLVGHVPELYQIGDAKKPRKVHDAIFEGWFLGTNV